MKNPLIIVLFALALAGCQRGEAAPQDSDAGKKEEAVAARKGIVLEDLTWIEAEEILTEDAIVVIPLGARAKEHGPHLKLRNDYVIARYLRDRLLEREEVVAAPIVSYHYYPAFLEYPGSTHLRLQTARDLMVDIVRSLANYGPRRFYILNTGVSTVRALKPAVAILEKEGLLVRYTDILEILEPIEDKVSEQEGGTHADEIETSMMLVMDPASVDMSKAVKDYHPGAGPLTRDAKKPGKFSKSGIFGDATLASRAKGEAVVRAYVEGIAADIQELRKAPLPAKK